MIHFNSTNDYITAFSGEVKSRMEQMRATIQKAAPEAEEMISYGMPAYKQNGKPLVYFAGYKNHTGFYPMPAALLLFKDELSGYKGSKGAVQFPHNQPLPLELIAQMVKFRVEENVEKAKAKKS